MKRSILRLKGFTLIELLVVLAIFSILTGTVIAKYGTYSKNALFANASEDLILAVRQTQAYGVSAKKSSVVCNTLDALGNIISSSAYECRYGIYASMATPNKIIIFSDVDDSKTFNVGDTTVETITLKAPITISTIDCLPHIVGCAGNVLNVTFKRPAPDATITDSSGGLPGYESGQIVITNGSKYSTTTIGRAGQISLQ